MIVLLSRDLIQFPELPALRPQLLVGLGQALVLPADLILLRAGDIHEIVEPRMLHLIVELQVLLQQGLLLTLYALVRKEELELALGLQLGPEVLQLQILIDLHAVPLVQLGQQEEVQLLQVLRLHIERLAQHEHPGEVFEDVGNKK